VANGQTNYTGFIGRVANTLEIYVSLNGSHTATFRRQVFGLGENTFLGGKSFCFYYLLKTNFSGHNKTWGRAQKKCGVELPRMPPRGHGPISSSVPVGDRRSVEQKTQFKTPSSPKHASRIDGCMQEHPRLPPSPTTFRGDAKTVAMQFAA